MEFTHWLEPVDKRSLRRAEAVQTVIAGLVRVDLAPPEYKVIEPDDVPPDAA